MKHFVEISATLGRPHDKKSLEFGILLADVLQRSPVQLVTVNVVVKGVLPTLRCL